MLMVGVAKCPLCEVTDYYAGSDGTKISVCYTELQGVRCSGVLNGLKSGQTFRNVHFIASVRR